MRKQLFAIFIFTGLSIFGAENESLTIDTYFSPYAGADDILLGQSILENLENRLGHKKQAQNTVPHKMLRTANLALVWGVIGGLEDVIQHEIFGHGYRLRDIHNDPIGYEVTPWGGATSFNLKPNVRFGELIAVDIAGIEAENILAGKMKMQWMATGEVNAFRSALYTRAQLSLLSYSLLTKQEDIPTGKLRTGNDIAAYIADYNRVYPSDKISLAQVQELALINLIDPMIYFSFYSQLRYIFTGQQCWKFPSIKLSESVRWLPNGRLSLAPYGFEGYFENFLSINGNPLYTYFRGGNRSFGGGIHSPSFIAVNKKLSLGGTLDLWKQHRFLTSSTITDDPANNPELDQSSWGISGSVITTAHWKKTTHFFAEVGAKTSGYLPGYSLTGGLFIRAGMKL